MNILGISASRHDCGACLLQDNQIVATACEDRPAGRRASFPLHCLDRCLEEGDIELHDVDIIAVCDMPSLQLKRIIAQALAHAPTGVGAFLEETSLWMEQQLWISKQIFTTSGFKGKIIFPGRHQSLASAAFFTARFSEAAVLTLDKGAEWATTAYGTGSYNTISIMAEQFFPHSLDFCYSALLNYLGYKTVCGEAEFLQLAERGEPTFKKMFLAKLIDLKDDGSFRLNMNYFSCCSDPAMNGNRFARLLQRQTEARLLQTEGAKEDLACSVRDVIEDVVLQMVRHLQHCTGLKKLCLTGGSVLSCVDKNRILSESAFTEIYMVPAAGSATGAALFALYACPGRSLPVDIPHAEPEFLPC
jgi:carbamoyltransferase